LWSVLVRCFVSKEEDGHVSFSSLILSLCRVHSREWPVWSCGVVEWIGRPLISPTPSPDHRQVTYGRRYEKYVGLSTLDEVDRAGFTLPLRHPDEEQGLDKQASYYELGKMGPSPGTNGTARRRLSRNLLASTSRSRPDQ